MKDQAQYVVIGGGIFGVNIAYHLAKRGVKDIILLEKMEIASGETGHAAGLCTQFSTSETLLKFRMYSIELYSELGLFDHVGSLRVASSKEQLRELQRSVSRAKGIGLEVEMITPDEAVKLMPQITDKELYGAIYLPRDGHLDPYLTTTSMAKLVREMGVAVYTNTRVTGVELSPSGEVRKVLTDKGDIKTEVVINATGLWGPQVAAMAGINIPTTPYDHQHIMLKAVPGNEFPHQTPCLRDPDNLVYMREEAGGLVIGGYEPNPKERWIDAVPWEHGNMALPPDFNRFEQLLEGAIRRLPFLEKAEMVGLTCHPGAYTPDCQPIVGPVPGAKGLWMACGMSLNGFGGAGGVGKALTEWLLDGEASVDMYPFRATRFGRYFESKIYASERTRESVKYYYKLRFPSDENEWARPHRISPLHYRMMELGAVFGEKYGWERVIYVEPGKPSRRQGADQHKWGWGKAPYFDRVGVEHMATRERVCLYDMSSFGKVDLIGPGALPLLQRLAVNDISKPVGNAVYTQFLNSQGGIIADVTVTRIAEDHFRVVTGAGFIGNELGWTRMNVHPDDPPVEIRDVTTDYAVLSMWGPKARQVLEKVTSDDVSNEALPYVHAKYVNIKGAQVLAVRVSYVGELGWEMYIENKWAVQVFDALYAAGQEFGIEVGGYKALDTLRMEKAYRYFSGDMTTQENPFEAGLGFCVQLDKGDFIGRDALVKAKEKGLTKKLCTLVLDGDEYVTVYGGEAIYLDGKVVSRVRSANYGHLLKKNILLAYLPIELAKKGNRFKLDVFDRMVDAEVTQSILYDPKGEKLRA